MLVTGGTHAGDFFGCWVNGQEYGIERLFYAYQEQPGEAAAGRDAWIVRTSWLFGWTGTNFVRTMLHLGSEHDEVAVVDDQRGSPTYVGHLAGAVGELLELPLPPSAASDELGSSQRATRCTAAARLAGRAASLFGAPRTLALGVSCRSGSPDRAAGERIVLQSQPEPRRLPPLRLRVGRVAGLPSVGEAIAGPRAFLESANEPRCASPSSPGARHGNCPWWFGMPAQSIHCGRQRETLCR
jgi:hypothetical protein